MAVDLHGASSPELAGTEVQGHCVLSLSWSHWPAEWSAQWPAGLLYWPYWKPSEDTIPFVTVVYLSNYPSCQSFGSLLLLKMLTWYIMGVLHSFLQLANFLRSRSVCMCARVRACVWSSRPIWVVGRFLTFNTPRMIFLHQFQCRQLYFPRTMFRNLESLFIMSTE